MLCGQEAQGGRPDSPPPTEFNKESWRKAIGLQSPSSGTEVIYESPEVYEEENEPIYSPETKKRRMRKINVWTSS